MLLDLEEGSVNETDGGSTVTGSLGPSNIDSRNPEPLLHFDSVSVSRESSESSLFTGSSRNRSDRKPRRRKASTTQHTASTINYHGINIYQAAAQGSLPLCVLLWGMASAKRVSLMAPDSQGNNPMHHAVLADSPEVLAFLMQQSRGQFSSDIKLVESRNHAGETPLLRAMSTGVNAVVKALIDESSDLLVTDFQGNSVFTVLAKSGHLWCLNYVYETICHRYGSQVALELMSSLDNEFHSPLDWAADNGDVNVMEFIMRKGISPMRCDSKNRSPLYWAVKAGRVSAARYLVKCGCNPDYADSEGTSPRALARSSGSSEMLLALRSYRRNADVPHYTIAEDANDTLQSIDPFKAPKPYSVDIYGRKHSHAIFNHCNSNLRVSLFFGTLVLLVWILAAIVPFYAWIALITLAIYAYRTLHRRAKDKRKINKENKRSILNELLLAPEKGLGVWIGCVVTMIMYLACSYFDSFKDHRGSTEGAHTTALGGSAIYNPTDMGGLSGAREDRELFFAVCFFLFVSIVTWLKLVWFDRNPGIVDTRETDFQEIMGLSLAVNGAPSAQQYCKTTLVKKPMRSKYCVRSGCVVARMDHYCVWLHSTIGYGNHRTFIVFLMAHLLLAMSSSILIGRALNREIGSEDACSVLIYGVLDERYFFSSILFLFVCLLTLGLAALSFEQLGNIAFNMTTNERINRSRYSWMSDEEGRPHNKFDRGIISNILEFWRVPGYAVDYMNVFDIPSNEEPDRSSLTHENVMRLATPPRGSLTASNSGSSTGANFTVRNNKSINQRQLGASLNGAEVNKDQPIPATTSPATSTWLGGAKDNDGNFTNITGNPNPPHHIPPAAENGSPNRYDAKQKSGSNRLMQMSTSGVKTPASSSNVEMTQVRQRADSVDSNSELGDLMV